MNMNPDFRTIDFPGFEKHPGNHMEVNGGCRDILLQKSKTQQGTAHLNNKITKGSNKTATGSVKLRIDTDTIVTKL